MACILYLLEMITWYHWQRGPPPYQGASVVLAEVFMGRHFRDFLFTFLKDLLNMVL